MVSLAMVLRLVRMAFALVDWLSHALAQDLPFATNRHHCLISSNALHIRITSPDPEILIISHWFLIALTPLPRSLQIRCLLYCICCTTLFGAVCSYVSSWRAKNAARLFDQPPKIYFSFAIIEHHLVLVDFWDPSFSS